MDHDPVNAPMHYTQHKVECIEITETMSFCRGNAVKYLYRAGAKDNELEDLRKARWYLNREIDRLERSNAKQSITRSSTGPASYNKPK